MTTSNLMESGPLIAEKPEENSLISEQLLIEKIPNIFYRSDQLNSTSLANDSLMDTAKMSDLETPTSSQNNETSSSNDVIENTNQGEPPSDPTPESLVTKAKDSENNSGDVVQENNSVPLVSNTESETSPLSPLKQDESTSKAEDERTLKDRDKSKSPPSQAEGERSQDQTEPPQESTSEAQEQQEAVPEHHLDEEIAKEEAANEQSNEDDVAMETESEPVAASTDVSQVKSPRDNETVESETKENDDSKVDQDRSCTPDVAGVLTKDEGSAATNADSMEEESKQDDIQATDESNQNETREQLVSEEKCDTPPETSQPDEQQASSGSLTPDQMSQQPIEENSKESPPKESPDNVMETAPLETETKDSVSKETTDTAAVDEGEQVPEPATKDLEDGSERKDSPLPSEEKKEEEMKDDTTKETSSEQKDEAKILSSNAPSSQAAVSPPSDKQPVMKAPSITPPSSSESDTPNTQTTTVTVSPTTSTINTAILSQSSTLNSTIVTMTTSKDSSSSIPLVTAATAVPQPTITQPLPTTATLLTSSSSSSTLSQMAAIVSQQQQAAMLSKSQPNLVPVIAHAPVLKSALKHTTVNVFKEQSRIATMGAEKLKVGEVEMLQPTSDLQRQQKKIEVKSREEIVGRAPPQVAVIPPIIDLTKVSEARAASEGVRSGGGEGVKKRGGDRKGGSGAVIIEKTANMAMMMHRKEDIKSSESDVKSSPHPVARRIWMSSCRPLDPASLERIGVDSKGNVYWYDGGKNMFLSPPSSDPAYKPSESELQLACKSMVQWTAKLKELRNSSTEEDIKLAQCIKDQFLNRVRVATQRKPRDISVLQKLQAVHNIRHPIVAATLPQTATVTAVVSQSSGGSGGGGGTDASKAAQLVPAGAFPQGSILVVPHHGGQPGFHAVLPVFANTVIMQQQQQQQQQQQSHAQVSVTSQQQAITLSSTQASTVTKNVTKVTPQVVQAPSGSSVIQSSATSSKEGDQTKEKQNEKQQKQQATLTPTIALPPNVLPQALANTVLSQAALKYHPSYQQALALAGYTFPTVMSMKVEDAVQLSTVDFESKSIEITGEVPIKKVEVSELKGMEERLLAAGSDEQEEVTVDQDDEDLQDEKTQALMRKKQDKKQSGKLSINEEGAGTSFQGRSSTEVMSAKLLLSLTDGPHNIAKEASKVLTPSSSLKPIEESSPAGSAPHTPSSGRKRKQKPIASAKPGDSSFVDTPEATPGGDKPTPKGKRVRKPKQQAPPEGEQEKPTAKSPPKKRGKKQDKPATAGSGQNKPKQLSPQELLTMLDVPPSANDTPAKPTPKSKLKQKDVDEEQPLPMTTPKASAKMEQLKASRTKKPMKEFVIETDSESDSSSSGSSSSRFSPNSGSSSDSSSESSSENEKQSENETPKTPQKKPSVRGRGSARGRGSGRGRGRGRGRIAKGRPPKSPHSSSSGEDENSSSDEDDVSPTKKRGPASKRGGVGRGRGRRGGRGAAGRRPSGHIVRIPTSLLAMKPTSGRKRKSIAEKEIDSDGRRPVDYGPDVPVDLATLYASKGGVDLGTLTELAKNLGVSESELGVTSRSKRTCVRVRQEITKLQEILKDDHSDVKPSPPSRSRGRGRSRGGGARSSGGDTGSQESVTAAAPVKKYRRPAYSQFTHKRRKRKKKQPEEEALWQPARPMSGESLKPIYVFSTSLANKAADAVIINKYDNIIQFHQAQPKGPGFLRLPQDEKPAPPTMGSGRSKKQTENTDHEKEKEPASGRGSRRRSARLSTEGSGGTTRRRGGLRGRSPDEEQGSGDERSRSPPPFLRSSRRLRRQRNNSSGMSSPPPPAVHSPPSTSENAAKSPISSSPPSGSLRSRSTRATRNGTTTMSQQRSSRRRRRSSQDSLPKSPTATGSTESTAEEDTSERMEEDVAAPSSQQQQDEKTFKEFDESEYQAKKLKLDENQQPQSSPGMQSPEQQPSVTQDTSDDVNYTICHGTPANKSPGIDVSSPRNWVSPHHPQHQHQQQHRQANMSAQQQQQHLQQQQHQQQQAARTYPAHQATPAQDSRAAQQGEVRSGGQYADGRGVRVNEHFQVHQQQGSSEQPTPQHPQAHREANSWGAVNLASQFHGVPAGYPGVYNPGLAAMPYPAHAGQAVHGANYPYPMPYPWGHHHTSQLASHSEQVLQHQQRQLKAQELSAHQSSHSAQEVYQQQQQQQQQHARSGENLGQIAHGVESPSSLVLRQGASATTQPSSSAQKPPGMDKHALTSPQSHVPPQAAAALHQFPSPASGAHSLSHHIPHGFSRPPHATLTPEHLPPGGHGHPAFHYGFDAGAHSLSQMQMWQQAQSQMQAAPQIRMHPSHLPPHMAHHGLWYPASHMAQIMPGAGGEAPGIGKKMSKGSKSSAGDKLSANQNSSNNNNSDSVQSLHPSQSAMYSSNFHQQGAAYQSDSSTKNIMSPTNAAFSIEQLTTTHSNSKGDAHQQQQQHHSLFSGQNSSSSSRSDVPTIQPLAHAPLPPPQTLYAHNPHRPLEEHLSHTSAHLDRTRQHGGGEMGQMASYPN